MATRSVYPFTALVGQERMRLALLLHAVNPALGGVLVRGEKGTAKSTAVRALANLLPTFAAVHGCAFGCAPNDARNACDSCAERMSTGEQLRAVERPVPVVELPIGATEDRVLGSIDLETAIASGERRFEPGLLARANRGILYIDEVNLLGDHLVDVLLDAAAMGRNTVEREGISFSHPASFMLIGTMNPEEGDLRPQLLDRFALVVEVEGLSDPTQRAEVVRRRIAFERDPNRFIAAQAAVEEAERQRLTRARALLPKVQVPETMLNLIARVCATFAVDGMRADLAIYRASAALAAYHGRTAVERDDIRVAAELALPHRRRRAPFEQAGLDKERLDEAMAEAEGDCSPRDGENSDVPAGGGPQPGERTDGKPLPPTNQSAARSGRGVPTTGERLSAPGQPLALNLPSPARRRTSDARGKRAQADRAHSGSPSGITVPKGAPRELALAATLRAAAPFQQARRTQGPGPALRLQRQDLRERLRRGRTTALVLFVVDASGSMGARDRMAASKGAALGMLLDAYRKRDRVGLIAFRDHGAELLLPPTNSVDLAEKRLRVLRTGGRTPLAAGLSLATETVERALRGTPSLAPLLVLVSDGRANAAPPGVNPWQAALQEAERIHAAAWRCLVLDTDRGHAGAGLARALAAALGAQHLTLDRVVPSRASSTPGTRMTRASEAPQLALPRSSSGAHIGGVVRGAFER